MLHHCGALNIARGLYVEASTSGVRRTVLVIFDVALHINPYRNALARLADDSMKWIYGSPRTSLPHFTTQELGRAIDTHTVQQHLDLWDAAALEVNRSGHPLPPTDSIVPAQISHWNGAKGGVDVRSRELRDSHNSPFKNIGLEAVFFDRVIMNILLNAFNAEKHCNIHSSLDKYNTFSQLNRAGRRDHSLNQFLSDVMQIFRKWGNDICTAEAISALISDEANDQTFTPAEIAKFTRDKKESFFCSAQGATFRTSAEHPCLHAINNSACVLCGHRDQFHCSSCCVHLCAIPKKSHPSVPAAEGGQEVYTSCWQLWHGTKFVLQTFRSQGTQLKFPK